MCERVLSVLLLNYSIPVGGINDPHRHHRKHPTTAPPPPHAHTHAHPRKEIPISPAPESLNSTPMNALIRPSAREPSDVDCILKRPLPPEHGRLDAILGPRSFSRRSRNARLCKTRTLPRSSAFDSAINCLAAHVAGRWLPRATGDDADSGCARLDFIGCSSRVLRWCAGRVVSERASKPAWPRCVTAACDMRSSPITLLHTVV